MVRKKCTDEKKSSRQKKRENNDPPIDRSVVHQRRIIESPPALKKFINNFASYTVGGEVFWGGVLRWCWTFLRFSSFAQFCVPTEPELGVYPSERLLGLAWHDELRGDHDE